MSNPYAAVYLERLSTNQTAPVRVSKKALQWLYENHSDWTTRRVMRGTGYRADGGVDVYLTRQEMKELWLLMDEMLDESVQNKSRPGVNSAIGMQRKIEHFLPGAPW